jgi:hypothetical protein
MTWTVRQLPQARRSADVPIGAVSPDSTPSRLARKWIRRRPLRGHRRFMEASVGRGWRAVNGSALETPLPP